MELAEILAVVQILGGLGAVALDITKIAEVIRKDGRTKATVAEEAQIEALMAPHVAAMEAHDPVGFLKAASPGHAGG